MKELDSFSLKKRLMSFRFAFNGIKNLIKYEYNARIHLVSLICVIVLGIILKLDLAEWIAISIVSGLVMLTELLNTAIEKLADYRVFPDCLGCIHANHRVTPLAD